MWNKNRCMEKITITGRIKLRTEWTKKFKFPRKTTSIEEERNVDHNFIARGKIMGTEGTKE